MYKVYCDSYLLYADSHNDYKIASPKLELELNKAGKFEFSIYPTHPSYRMIEKMKSLITVYHDDSLVFRGRVLNSERGWINEQKIVCEGELAFLNDSVTSDNLVFQFEGMEHPTISFDNLRFRDRC